MRQILPYAERETMIARGELYSASLDPVVGSEQGGIRPVLIIQNDVGNRYSPTVIVLAVTGQLGKARLPTHVNVPAQGNGLAKDSVVLAEQIREMESSVETLKKLDEQEGVFCAPQTGTVESLQLMQGQTSGQVGGSISDPERGYQIRFALEAEDAVQDTAGVTVTVMQGAKSESVKINSSVSQQDGGVVLSAALTGSDWQVGKAELTIRLSETEYDCCLPVSALHSDNGGDFVYSVEERNTILGLQNIVRKVYVEVVERNNELAALRNYTTGAPVVAATTKSLQEGARVRTAG